MENEGVKEEAKVLDVPTVDNPALRKDNPQTTDVVYNIKILWNATTDKFFMDSGGAHTVIVEGILMHAIGAVIGEQAKNQMLQIMMRVGLEKRGEGLQIVPADALPKELQA